MVWQPAACTNTPVRAVPRSHAGLTSAPHPTQHQTFGTDESRDLKESVWICNDSPQQSALPLLSSDVSLRVASYLNLSSAAPSVYSHWEYIPHQWFVHSSLFPTTFSLAAWLGERCGEENRRCCQWGDWNPTLMRCRLRLLQFIF